MPCPLCSHDKTYKHGKTSKGSQRYRCLKCKQTFTSTFDTIYYRRQVSFEEVRIVLQSHCEGTSLRGISRISGLSYNTGVSLIRAASQKAQMVHNALGTSCGYRCHCCGRIVVVCGKKQKHCLLNELEAGDCWIALSLAQLNGLILSGRVDKHTDKLAIELVASTEGKTNCKEWHTDGWGGYERVLRNDEVEHYISKALTQRLERTNGTIRQQTGRWHRLQNKFAQVWEQTKVTLRLIITYFNWIWVYSRLGTTAAQRADLTSEPWNWLDIAVYSTLC